MMTRAIVLAGGLLAAFASMAPAQQSAPATVPPAADPRIVRIAESVSAERIESDVRTLAGFGTRHTLSDTLSQTRGIGAARRWIKAQFDQVSRECGGCLEVYYQRELVKGGEGSRIPEDAWVVNVVAVQRGKTHPNRHVLITGHYDSRASNVMDAASDAPGANDDASGTAAVIEAARVLSGHTFDKTIVYAALAGEEQGLFGGHQLARMARDSGWVIEGVLNNDIIGNSRGISGARDNTTFRIFSEPTPPTTTEREHRSHRFYGGEVDGASRQLARYVDRITDLYINNLDAMMIYRLDRFGRGGDHRPFNDLGFPGVRITEIYEDYTRQHQNLRTEDGVEYGDVPDAMDFGYAAKLTAVNTAALAALAWAPPPPENVRIRGGGAPSTTLSWAKIQDPGIAGYKVYWRLTTEPQWTHSRFVGDVDTHTLEGIVIDNYLFGVAAVGIDGNESTVVFPSPGR